MASRSLGSLVAFINADSTNFMREFAKVDRQIARASASFTKPGAKLALGFIGVQNVLSSVANEVRHVVQNIENIRGVSPETTASIITLRDNLRSAKEWIDQMTAGIIGFGVQAAQAVGVGAASLAGYDDTSGLSKLQTPDDIARGRDDGFDAKIDAARKKLLESSKAAALATQNEAQQIRTLRDEAERYETFAKSKEIDTVQRLEARADAQDKLREASTKMAALNKQLADSEDAVRKSMTGVFTASVSRADAIKGLENKSTRLFMDLAATGKDSNDPDGVKRRIELNKELAATQSQLGTLYEKNAVVGRQVGESIAGAFEDAIFEGKKFSDVLKGLLVDLVRLEFRKAAAGLIGNFVSGLFGGTGGGSAGVAGVGKFLGPAAASGGYRDGSKPYLVGEEGPEIFSPGRAGTIIPAGKTASLMGGGSAGMTVFIDATGADAAAIARLESRLTSLNASIERRAVGAVVQAKRRGGGTAYALA